jgi:hydroxyethylthiazole kinase-like uncharacterized protein yjeF
MKTVKKSIFKQIRRPEPLSNKGENGRIMIIAGSEKFHGALLLAVQAASRIVDVIYIYSTEENFGIVKKLKGEIASFVSVLPGELWETAEKVDAILIGPGLKEIKENVDLTHELLEKYPNKKFVIDATALWHLKPEWLNENCVVTPHRLEFENVFKKKATSENVHQMAKKYGATIVSTGHVDFISNGKEMWQNKTGNAGMTKGGTGDILAGLITAFASTNELLPAALAGAFLNGYAGDKLHAKVGTFYNSEDLSKTVGKVWKRDCC